jgi:integrase
MTYIAQAMEENGHPMYQPVAAYIRMCFGRDIRMDELTKSKVIEFRDYLKRIGLSQNTVFNKLNALRTFTNIYNEEDPIPIKDKRIFRVKKEDTVSIYLDKIELTMLENKLPELSPGDRYYATKFLIGAYTGCRQSDILHITPAHINHGMLTYVAEKTGKKVTVPITQKTADWIAYVQERYDQFDGSLSTPGSQRMTYNRHLRQACKAAHINEPAVTVRGGKEKTQPKWKAVTSHAARRSFATNLYLAGMDPHQVSKLLGHFSAEITLRCYICAERTTMPEAALAYFQ